MPAPGQDIWDPNLSLSEGVNGDGADGDLLEEASFTGGGDKEAVAHLDPIFKALAPGRGDIPRTGGREKMAGTAEEGYLYCGPSGAGHFVKMVHNGIEYGLMQAYAEGFDILKSKAAPEIT